MRNPAFRALGLLLLSALPLAAQSTPAADFDRARDAWWYGRYPEALEALMRVAGANDARSYVDSVALLTGELYRTREITRDGRTARWSGTGRYVTYDSGTGRARVTKVVSIEGTPRVVAELRASAVAFAPDDSRVAYLGIRVTPEVETARRDLERLSAAQPPDRAAITAKQTELTQLEAQNAMLVVRDLPGGREREIRTPELRVGSIAYGAGGTLYVVAARTGDERRSDVYAIDAAGAVKPVVSDDSIKVNASVVPGGRFLTFGVSGSSPFARAAGGRGGPGGGAAGGGGARGFGVHDLQTGTTSYFAGSAPAFSASGNAVAFLTRNGAEYAISVAGLPVSGAPTVVKRATVPLAAPALSPAGRTVAFQIQAEYDWEIHAVDRDGSNERRVTRELQHDLSPRFLDETRIVSQMGEARHRRSFMHDVNTGARTRLFDNNTVRTIAPEYEWAVSPDATKLLVVAERDGDTVSPERGVYVMDLTSKVTPADLLARLRASLAAETALRAAGQKMYAPIADAVKARVADVSVPKVYSYEKALFDFDSKNITRPGNAKAVQYLADRYRSFGYEVELQPWTTTQQGRQITAHNVVATLRGTVNPELIYVIGAHLDSRAEGPGADDNTSGTAAILEAARVLAKHPQPATIVFVAFNGEESGLLGSRAFADSVSRKGWKVVGALNNDMLGWSNDGRLDNTIRYSNPGIRDVQHSAAFLFSDLVTYDAVYYKSTDAQALYDAWGDIIGGIGSYPVLGNPHYHMPHDNLEFENHQLIAEVAKTTAATAMLLASSPSRLTGLKAALAGGAAEVTWSASPEKGVARYVVKYGPASNPEANTVTVTEPRARLNGVAAGTVISVKAVNDKGLEGWDWARVVVGR